MWYIGQKTLEGRVIKAMSGYAVVLAEGREMLCRPRGRLRLEGGDVLSGDRVAVLPGTAGRGTIVDVMERSSALARPPVANVDLVLAVFTLRRPPLNLSFLDRLLAAVSLEGISSALCLNKIDLLGPEEAEPVVQIYSKAGFQVRQVSALMRWGVDALRQMLAGRVCVLAGESGVGKSMLAKRLRPDAATAVGEVAKTGRGRHTTKWVQLLDIGGGWLVDSPGFERIDLGLIPPEQLGSAYPEIRERKSRCRFADCLHDSEPGCAVKEAVKRGEISSSRYESYANLLQEVMSNWKGRFSPGRKPRR